METVNTPVLTLRATLAAPVTLAIAWMITNVTAQVSTYSCDLNHPLNNLFPHSDIDECGRDPPPCHVDANCTNIEGNFTCTCNTGFTGDGLEDCVGRLV